ncbi:hypothetical protein SISSUDRAFT_1061227 [Sistotremastrum suecicum HHB10207 ss-3]|uniref:Uncharacterized protein n=1 Tax=Sistotremastrum suecicum HHB10207 ss-3 TaxID=1314776 RepID=A0A166E7M6_9AGAM|nr:hypothetical protein SISSUDRAFT_1061227 [Sistotremastrum suecicum HHB10207 ss-3]
MSQDYTNAEIASGNGGSGGGRGGDVGSYNSTTDSHGSVSVTKSYITKGPMDATTAAAALASQGRTTINNSGNTFTDNSSQSVVDSSITKHDTSTHSTMITYDHNSNVLGLHPNDPQGTPGSQAPGVQSIAMSSAVQSESSSATPSTQTSVPPAFTPLISSSGGDQSQLASSGEFGIPGPRSNSPDAFTSKEALNLHPPGSAAYPAGSNLPSVENLQGDRVNAPAASVGPQQPLAPISNEQHDSSVHNQDHPEYPATSFVSYPISQPPMPPYPSNHAPSEPIFTPSSYAAPQHGPQYNPPPGPPPQSAGRRLPNNPTLSSFTPGPTSPQQNSPYGPPSPPPPTPAQYQQPYPPAYQAHRRRNPGLAQAGTPATSYFEAPGWRCPSPSPLRGVPESSYYQEPLDGADTISGPTMAFPTPRLTRSRPASARSNSQPHTYAIPPTSSRMYSPPPAEPPVSRYPTSTPYLPAQPQRSASPLSYEPLSEAPGWRIPPSAPADTWNLEQDEPESYCDPPEQSALPFPEPQTHRPQRYGPIKRSYTAPTRSYQAYPPVASPPVQAWGSRLNHVEQQGSAFYFDSY